MIAFNYFGGKFTWLEYLYSNFPERFTHLVDLFAGSMAVSLNYHGRVIKTANEINTDITNFFEILRDREAELVRLLLLTPCSEQEYKNCLEPSPDPLESARRFYVRVRQSFFGLGAQRRSAKDKTPVIGLLQRDGKIRAKKTTDVSSKSLTRFIRENVKEGSTISTDEWAGYNRVSERFTHLVVSHGHGQYVDGIAHTNTLEGFWSLFKRGIIGQYHQISRKYLDKYVDEFCFRYNHRNVQNVFDMVIAKGLNLYCR